MDKLPFTVYDIFAYLSSGAVLIFTADYIWSAGLLHQQNVGAIFAVALLMAAYVTGHVVAHFSSLIFEKGLVRHVLQPPSIRLRETKSPSWLKYLFRNYYEALQPTVQAQITRQAKLRGCTATGEDFFQHAFPLVTANEAVQARLDVFRNQYGFARNMAFAFLVSAVALAEAHGFGSPVKLRWAALACLAGVSLFYRYLKFFRQYTYELLLRYSALSEPQAKAAAASKT